MAPAMNLLTQLAVVIALVMGVITRQCTRTVHSHCNIWSCLPKNVVMLIGMGIQRTNSNFLSPHLTTPSVRGKLVLRPNSSEPLQGG